MASVNDTITHTMSSQPRRRFCAECNQKYKNGRALGITLPELIILDFIAINVNVYMAML